MGRCALRWRRTVTSRSMIATSAYMSIRSRMIFWAPSIVVTTHAVGHHAIEAAGEDAYSVVAIANFFHQDQLCIFEARPASKAKPQEVDSGKGQASERSAIRYIRSSARS